MSTLHDKIIHRVVGLYVVDNLLAGSWRTSGCVLFFASLGFILLRYKIFFPLGMVRLPYPFRRVPTMRLKDSVSVSTKWRTSLIRYGLELRHSWCQLILFLYIIGFSYSLIYFLYIPYFIILLPYFFSFFFSFFQYKTFIYIKNWFGAHITA